MVVDHHQCFGVVLPPAMWFKTEKSTQKWFQNTKASSNIKKLETLSMEVSSVIHLHMSTIDYMKRLSAFCAHKKHYLRKHYISILDYKVFLYVTFLLQNVKRNKCIKGAKTSGIYVNIRTLQFQFKIMLKHVQRHETIKSEN